MKRMLAFSVRDDERQFIERYADSLDGVEVDCTSDPISLETVDRVSGYDGVSVLGVPIDRDILAALKERGIIYMASRSIGYDNIDLEAARELGVHVSNVEYSPGSVAEYALMLILMSMRKAKLVIRRSDIQDFSLMGSHGRELGNSTVGIIGTGRIGGRLAKYLSGFGCKVLGYDPYPNVELADLVEYVELDELLERSDAITLHTLFTGDNYHLLNSEAFDKMREGVVIVNCSRGELIDSDALISALESGKVGAAALDVVEGDAPIFHRDWKLRPVINQHLAVLRSFPNVIVTPHIAFYTLDVVNEMVTWAIDSMIEFWSTGTASHELT